MRYSMAHFAKVVSGKVTQIIVAEPEFFDTFIDDTPGQWLETKTDGSIRKNYAGIGDIYDPVRDAFYAPQPFSSWTLAEDTCLWEAPTPMPEDDNNYCWNEDTTSWDQVDG